MHRPIGRSKEIIPPRSVTSGRWAIPAPRREVVGLSRRASALLVSVLGLLLVASLARMAADSMGVAAAPRSVEAAPHDHAGQAHAAPLIDKEIAAASGDRCAAQGLISVGETGLCTHGPDPVPDGLDVTGAGQPEVSGAGSASTVACEGDGADGLRVEVIYARPADRSDRYAAYLASFEQWAADADQIYRDSAAETGGSRAIRYVTTSPSGGECTVVVRDVVLSTRADDNFSFTIAELAQLGYSRTDRKYLIFMDAAIFLDPVNLLCGVGTMEEDSTRDGSNVNNFGPSYARVDADCWGGYVAAHELGHNLGAVQDNAPNSSRGGHCVDEYDVMCYKDEPHFPTMRLVCQPEYIHELLLDCNHDDYFHTSPPAGSYLDTNWNVASSRFLIGASDRPPPPPPANDDVSDALRASARPYTDLRAVPGATAPSSDPAPSCVAGLGGGDTHSVWYATRPASSGTITLDTAGSDYDTVLSVFTEAAGVLSEVACNDDLSVDARQARLSVSARAGTTYYVMVSGWRYSSPNQLRLRLDGPSETAAPRVALSKDKSKYNGIVEATISGFAPSAAVTLRWPRAYEVTVGPARGTFTEVLATGATDAAGEVTLAFRTPLDPYGDYDVTARDATGRTATTALRVIPRLLLNEVDGPRSTKLRVYFYGFAPSERIEVRWHAGASVATSYKVVKTLTVAANGRASSLVTIPSGTALGAHLIVGKVVNVGRSSSTPFLLTSGSPGLDPERSPTPTPQPTTTPTATPTVSPEPTPTVTPTETVAEPPTATPEPTATATPTPEVITPIPEASPIA